MVRLEYQRKCGLNTDDNGNLFSNNGKHMNWEDLKYFLAVARSEGLSEAARGLQVSPSTVSRRVSILEDAVGTTLFTRRQDGYALNEAGLNMLPVAEQAEASMLLLERGATQSKDEESGVVRVAVPELLGQYLLIPRLGELLDGHPNIQLEIVTDVRSSQLSKREADVVVRLTRPTQGDYTIQCIGQLKQGLYGSNDYIKRISSSVGSVGLSDCRVIGWESQFAYLPLAQTLEEHALSSNVAIR